MRVQVHRRPPERISAWLGEAEFAVEARLLLDPAEESPAGILFARPAS